MSSVQERLQLKRTALDKWSTREKLCLASVVSCSGDQNWMTVSRSIKLLCNENRPVDWFSQKSCAVQFGDLLGNVETPKRKRTTSDRESSYIAETPTESILRKFTQERISELKCTVQKEREEFAQLREEILLLQCGNVSDADVLNMWKTLVEEENKKAAEQKKHAQWLKEREERKIELQRAWKPPNLNHRPLPQQLNLTLSQQSDDMDIDETCSSSQPAGTSPSPLLSSLLKSSSPAPNAVMTPTSARVTAPTITNLLTGGTISPQITGSIIAPSPQSILQMKPLTGPIPSDNLPQSSLLPSPSQAAPTLSMLLENIKNSPKEDDVTTTHLGNCTSDAILDAEAADGSDASNKELLEVFDELPDMDELDEILTNNDEMILNPELLDGVESLIDEAEAEENLKESLEVKHEISKNQSPVDKIFQGNAPNVQQGTTAQIELKPPSLATTERQNIDLLGTESRTEVISSDDSSDNTNLQALKEQAKDEANKDNNSKIITASDVKVIKEEHEHITNESAPTSLIENAIKDNEDVLIEDHLDEYNIEQPALKLDTAKSSNSESSDVILIQTDEDSNEEKHQQMKNEGFKDDVTTDGSIVDEKMDENSSSDLVAAATPTSEVGNISKGDVDSKEASDGYHVDTATITIIDTDEDSCTTEPTKDDIKSDARKGDDDDMAKHTIAVRKLRERDRSESPLVEDEPQDSLIRSRRRYSSTPVIDSAPNSPICAEDLELKALKKTLMFVFNRLTASRNAAIFLHPLLDERYREVVSRPMDFPTIKKNIENGQIRNTLEFQRDLMMMCRNVTMSYEEGCANFIMAKDMMTECVVALESLDRKKEKDSAKEKEKQQSSSSSSSIAIKVRGGSRKSLRLP